MSATSDLRKQVDRRKRELEATYGREKHEREGWLPVMMFSLGFVAQGIAMDVDEDTLTSRIASHIANAELWVEEELQ